MKTKMKLKHEQRQKASAKLQNILNLIQNADDNDLINLKITLKIDKEIE